MRVKKKLVAFVTGLLMASGAAVAVAPPASAASTVSGRVQCVTGAGVVGIWVSANNGGSGWAWRSGSSNIVNWSYTLPYGGAYHVNVGCGGTTSVWASSNTSPTVSGNANFTCYDWINVGKGGFYGSCTSP